MLFVPLITDRGIAVQWLVGVKVHSLAPLLMFHMNEQFEQ